MTAGSATSGQLVASKHLMAASWRVLNVRRQVEDLGNPVDGAVFVGERFQDLAAAGVGFELDRIRAIAAHYGREQRHFALPSFLVSDSETPSSRILL